MHPGALQDRLELPLPAMASGSNQGSLRQRNVPGKSTSPAPPSAQIDDVALDKLAAANAKPVVSENNFRIAFAVITALAFVTRFWGISHPNEVVFDEVHFGKFASYYLERTYFFDVHPPLESFFCSHGLVGWLRWPFPL
ncbi:unnamed protein product [Parascedosporium putredinis]|uniref:ArnT-like N-terminal domain-containing protein n=1 Tax=Parascedosporium putredinis TaxID=1442378 RepID=A0A9P1MAZ2_9PEZI|nr:unnamed protein product [Parascedosporium putredinis]CAI7997731.1 unnamed protein product [Parascedosporium putredinis]